MTYCIQCGNNLQPDSRFCGRCGQAVVQAPAASSIRRSGSSFTGNHLPFLFAISGILILSVVVGLVFFFSTGLSATLSEDRLAELGLDDCRFVDDDAEEIFKNVDSNYKLTGEMDARYCSYENFHYYMYPATDFKEVFQSLLSRRFCRPDDLRARMDSARAFLEELKSSHIFQIGQYIFTADTDGGREALIQYFDANGLSVRDINIPITCF